MLLTVNVCAAGLALPAFPVKLKVTGLRPICGALTVTVTVALPAMAPLAAFTVPAYVPAVPPAVNVPVGLIAPPPATTLQVGVIASTLPAASRPTALKAWVPPLASVTLAGLSVIVARVLAATVRLTGSLRGEFPAPAPAT